MANTPVTCVLDRIDAKDVEAVEEVFRACSEGIIVDLRRVSITTPEGVALLARLVRAARLRKVPVDIVAVTPHARRALVAAGLHHLVSLSE